MGIGRQNPFKSFSALRKAIVSGLKNTLRAVKVYIKNVTGLVILTCFSLSIFALLGVQIYMGVLTSKCIRIAPFNVSEIDKVKDTEEFRIHANNRSNQYILPGRIEPMLCRENAYLCPENFICLTGFGSNPNYGYTNFDNFGWALLSSFRLLTQDFWEELLQCILIAAGPWHMIVFVVMIFLGSFYLLSLNLAIVSMTYYQLQRKAEKKKYAIEAEEAALQEASMDAAVIPTSADIDKEGDNHMIHKHEDENKKLDINDKEEADEKRKFKERCSKQCLKCIDFCCIWDCCTCWIYLQKFCSVIAFDPFMELFIILTVVANTLFMALDHHDMEPEFYEFLHNGNYFFTAIYIMEAVLKLLAMSPKFYFQDGWNRFDFFIAVSSFIELGFEGVLGLSILRWFRLLRPFKLAKTWLTLNFILSIMGRTAAAFNKATILFGILIYIFAFTGMQLFGAKYEEFKHLFDDGEVPRWNFTDFLHSFMTIFRAICGEWIETMWDCMLVSGWPCIPFFLAVVVICNLGMLILFRAVLLASSGLQYLSLVSAEGNTKGIAEVFKRISRVKNWLKQKLLGGHCADVKDQNMDQTMDGDDVDNSGMYLSPMLDDRFSPKDKKCQQKKSELKTTRNYAMMDTDTNAETESVVSNHKLETTSGEIILSDNLPDCCPNVCYLKIPFCAKDYKPGFWAEWNDLRVKTFILIKHKYYETIIISIIMISILALAAEDVHLKDRPLLETLLAKMEIVFTVLFFIDILLKWLAFGFKKYFTDAWNWLDFAIVMIYVINLSALAFGGGHLQAFKTMRTLRALQPLRALMRIKGPRVLVTVILKAIPDTCNVLLVFLFLWLIYAIMGIQFFGGKFFYCTDGEEMVNTSYVKTRYDCLAQNLTWINPDINFDNVLNAYLALFQVATFKGWIQIIYSAVDSTQIDEQPLREANLMMYLYFVFFAIIGSFFTLNLFLGVIIEIFNKQRIKAGETQHIFLSESDKNYYKEKYYNKWEKLRGKKPTPRPKFKAQALVFDLTTSRKFDMAIKLIIGLNMVVIAMEHYQIEKSFGLVLERLNMLFVAVLTTECALKIFAFRWYYFKELCNKFDFVIVILSILGVILKYLIGENVLPSSLLGVVRVIDVGRVLRLIRGARSVRFPLYILALLLPVIFTIFLLLFLVMFIYAIFGMSLFMTVKHRYGINENFNFETFGQSMILLFQMSTTAGWDGVLFAIMDETDCNPPNPETDDPGNCGSRGIAVAYLVSYLILSRLIIINIYIAIIFVTCRQDTVDIEEGLTDEDYDMYYEIWQNFDPDGTQFIRYEHLTDFLDALEEPLQIPKPNKYKIISMDITIRKGDLISCGDILDAVIKDYFARKSHVAEETDEIKVENRGDFELPSSTFRRQREEHCARVIQQGWRRYKAGEESGDGPKSQQQTTVVVESDGHMITDGHKVVISSRLPSVESHSTCV